MEASAPALAVARRNAAALGVAGRADLRRGDWFEGVTGRFDLVASNPPYIPAAEMGGLSPEVRGHEPPGALTPGGDGLDAFRAIAAGLGARLAPGGRALIEFGAGQRDAVAAIFAERGFDAPIAHRDMDGRPRILELRASGAHSSQDQG